MAGRMVTEVLELLGKLDPLLKGDVGVGGRAEPGGAEAGKRCKDLIKAGVTRITNTLALVDHLDQPGAKASCAQGLHDLDGGAVGRFGKVPLQVCPSGLLSERRAGTDLSGKNRERSTIGDEF